MRQIHTDGACRGNPGPGGWAALLSAGGREKDEGGHDGEPEFAASGRCGGCS